VLEQLGDAHDAREFLDVPVRQRRIGVSDRDDVADTVLAGRAQSSTNSVRAGSKSRSACSFNQNSGCSFGTPY
jgi:hypothetical protein